MKGSFPFDKLWMPSEVASGVEGDTVAFQMLVSS